MSNVTSASQKKYTMGQSPESSNDESVGGTPDTKLTAFSPEDTRSAENTPSNRQGKMATTSSHDPFVSTTINKAEQPKLSATAAAFQPYTIPHGPAVDSPKVAYGSGASATNAAAIPGTTEYLEKIYEAASSNLVMSNGSPSSNQTYDGSFSTDTGVSRYIQVRIIYNGDAKQVIEHVLHEFRIKGRLTSEVQYVSGSDNVAYLHLSNIQESIMVFKKLKTTYPGTCEITYLNAENFKPATTPTHRFRVSPHEGQLYLTARYPTNAIIYKAQFEQSLRDLLSAEGALYAWAKLPAMEVGAFRMIAELCDSGFVERALQRCNGRTFGSVKVGLERWNPDSPPRLSTQRHATDSTPTRRSADSTGISEALGRLAFDENDSSVMMPYQAAGVAPSRSSLVGPNGQMSMTANGLMAGMYGSQIIALPPNFGSVFTPPRQYVGDNAQPVYAQIVTPHGVNFSPAYVGGIGNHQDSPYSMASYHDTPSSAGTPGMQQNGRFSNRRQNAVKVQHNSRPRQPFSSAQSHHNHVDVHRIREGVDVRTTVMLRNIPNKVDQAMLKGIIDESSHGKYDFMYLRIDFSNDCNVGYAFINFTDPLDIIDFVVARSNQKWHRFKSDKVAEVSYATIQGKDCLVQKFRNSSVMLEPAHYRPKLFFTSNDPFGRAGEEDVFPPSDNASKLKRSCENAEHVGLFAPSAGQSIRDERRRRSQFDRGTSFSEREENGDDSDFQPGYYPTY